jgi:hypothetical protein
MEYKRYRLLAELVDAHKKCENKKTDLILSLGSRPYFEELDNDNNVAVHHDC